MHAFSRSLARAVKNARDKMNLTQEQVGELVDTNTRTISSIENGKSNTRMNILYPLVRVLRIDPNEIFGGRFLCEAPTACADRKLQR